MLNFSVVFHLMVLFSEGPGKEEQPPPRCFPRGCVCLSGISARDQSPSCSPFVEAEIHAALVHWLGFDIPDNSARTDGLIVWQNERRWSPVPFVTHIPPTGRPSGG